MTEYRTASRFAAQGFIRLALDGLERIRLADAETFFRLEELDAREAQLGRAPSEAMVKALARIHVANDNVIRAKTLADLHRATLMDSVDAACAALLSLVKQGMSRRHGSLAACPEGRAIGTTCLRDVVWQGRNQSQHCDEGRYTLPVRKVFAALHEDFGDLFDLGSRPRDNHALSLVLLLGWIYEPGYEADVQSLIG